MGQKEPGGRRCWAITAGVLSCIQGGAYLALAIAALALYYCEIETKFDENNPEPGFLIYLTYFYNRDCRANLGSFTEWPDQEFPTATLTWQWAIAYCAINGVWIFTSLFLTIAGAASSRNGLFRAAIPSLWLISTATVLVADVVASVMYGLDLGKILNADSQPILALLDFLDPNSQLSMYLAQKIQTDVAVIPSAALLIAVARGGILWILNLILFFGVLVSTIVSNKGKKTTPKMLTNQRPPEPAAATNARNDGFSWQHQQGGVHNPAYDRRGDEDVYAVSNKQRRPRDAEILAAEARRTSHVSSSHQELRNQRPWSYLDPAPEELEQVRQRPRTPPAEEWSLTPRSTLKLPRATLGHPQPTAPYPTQQNQYYHFPYPEQQYGNRYINTVGKHNPYLK